MKDIQSHTRETTTCLGGSTHWGIKIEKRSQWHLLSPKIIAQKNWQNIFACPSAFKYFWLYLNTTLLRLSPFLSLALPLSPSLPFLLSFFSVNLSHPPSHRLLMHNNVSYQKGCTGPHKWGSCREKGWISEHSHFIIPNVHNITLERDFPCIQFDDLNSDEKKRMTLSLKKMNAKGR